MADFRKWFTVLAVIAVMAFSASAQIGTATGGLPGSSAGALACVATAAGTPEMRPEGYAELAGDILITCTGGPTAAQGSAIPTTNIVVYMSPSVPITSRWLSSNGASEALLLIDDPGSALATGVVGFGPQAPQIGCTTAQQQQSGGSLCPAFVGFNNGYEVAVNAAGTGPAANVFQGKVGDFGTNSVTFYNVPVLPPATSGVYRTFRITNIRVPIPGEPITTVLNAYISTSPNQTLPVSGATLNIGSIGNPLKAGVSKPTSFPQCTAQSVQLASYVQFTEGFATAFKTRVVPGGTVPVNSTYAAEAQNMGSAGGGGLNNNIQNVPGGLYNGFAANTESGLIFPGFSGANGSGIPNSTAGLADWGTRVRALFYNLPAGVTLYVSTVNSNYSSTFTPGGTSLTSYALLVATSTSGEGTADGTAFTPIAGNSKITSSDGLPAVALAPNANGVYEAVWEVTNANPSGTDSLQFSVYISYAPTAATGTGSNPYGTPPPTGYPIGAPVTDAILSFAVDPVNLNYSTANGTQGVYYTPRWAVTQTLQGPYVTINLCQTTLLYPFVTSALGEFDTGMAVANTSMDPFKTVTQQGSCTLYPYGVTVGTSGNTPYPTTPIPGCDTIANPSPGMNCFPVVAPGTVQAVLASQTLTSFQGYVIAICNFWYAHGYASVTDLGIRNLFSAYLALELNNAFGTPRQGVAGVEALIH